MSSECYIELHKGNKYDVEASQGNTLGEKRMPEKSTSLKELGWFHK